MPTLPSGPEPPPAPNPNPNPNPGSEPHQARHMAESFGADAERYDRMRPRYPDALVERIVAGPGPGPGRAVADVLDVGIGTGIAARQFQAAGCRVLGVDVDARMADWARRTGLEVEVAKFEDWDPAGRTFDAVVAAQAWHWVDPVAGAVRAARVLRPGGRLAVFWNVSQPAPEMAEAFAAIYARILPDSPIYRRGLSGVDAYGRLLDKAAEGMRQAGVFDEPEEWRFDWDRTYTRDEWLELVPTAGGFDQFPADVARELLAAIGDAVDAFGGSFAVRYTAVAVTAVRIDAA